MGRICTAGVCVPTFDNYLHICRVTEGKARGKRVYGDRIDSDEEETAPEKRLRLAKEYLSQLEQEGTCTCSTIKVSSLIYIL